MHVGVSPFVHVWCSGGMACADTGGHSVYVVGEGGGGGGGCGVVPASCLPHLTAADPVALHLLDTVCPVKLIQVFQQPETHGQADRQADGQVTACPLGLCGWIERDQASGSSSAQALKHGMLFSQRTQQLYLSAYAVMRSIHCFIGSRTCEGR